MATDSSLSDRLFAIGLDDDASPLFRYTFYGTTLLILLISLFPFYYLVMLALSKPGNTTQAGLLPAGFDPTSFIGAFQAVPFHLYMRNSLLIATGVTAFVLVFASLAGYTFGRMEFRGKRPLFLLLISVSYFPGATFIVGLFKLLTGNVTVLGVSSPNLFNSPAAVGLPLTALSLPFAILLLTTFYSQIPDGLEDAARVTGTTRIGALYRIIAPLSAPGFVTAGILTFITAYNEFFFSQLMTTGSPQNWSPIVWGLLRYQTEVSVRYDLMAAASLIGVVPVALIVLLAQRKIVSGLTSGSIKG
ncbi:carbohydrate ABC transporter permease [Halomicroarcula limicola]|uniref:Carbohydrate ABC transporter permease n=1 Tax=Haloarcula limicola TaxID=1429915 RepID=A0A8J7Y8B5_9EURY|nr:carbohydrate ABC transporter permease [Halomicroarcula limicola]MBV0925942.1 carbohydrate ABC transporter permease [Halomicroarcula limicola]